MLYYFCSNIGNVHGAFGLVAVLYSCVVHYIVDNCVYKVQKKTIHECARGDLGGRAAIALSRVIGKLQRFVDPI